MKYDYYRQTARYFERESGIARHFSAWTAKDQNPKRNVKDSKPEELDKEREKLKQALKEEEEANNKKLEELKEKEKQESERLSLQQLRDRIQEKRAEQSLYYPKISRRNYLRHQESSINCQEATTAPILRRGAGMIRAEKMSLQDTNLRGNRDAAGARQISGSGERRHFTTEKYSSTERQDMEKKHFNVEVDLTVRQDNNEEEKPLTTEEDTSQFENDEKKDFTSDGSSSHNEKKHFNAKHVNPFARHEDIEKEDDSSVSETFSKCAIEGSQVRSYNSDGSYSTELEQVPPGDLEYVNREKYSSTPVQGVVDVASPKRNVCAAGASSPATHVASACARWTESLSKFPWVRQDEAQQGQANRMNRFWTHEDVLAQMDDLERREQQACMKQNWDEALRLRDMRNKLELLREKDLYDEVDLRTNDESREFALQSFLKRTRQLEEREEACHNSSMYSEEAKLLWQKWVREDEESAVKHARAHREVLMKDLEKDWQGLASKDKDRVDNAPREQMRSFLQEEHNLMAAVGAPANTIDESSQARNNKVSGRGYGSKQLDRS